MVLLGIEWSVGAVVAQPGDNLSDIYVRMRDSGLRYCPVVDDGRLIGIVAADRVEKQRQASGEFPGSFPSRLHVDDVMSYGIAWCLDSASLAEIAAKIVESQGRSIALITENGCVTRLVTANDVLALLVRHGDRTPWAQLTLDEAARGR